MSSRCPVVGSLALAAIGAATLVLLADRAQVSKCLPPRAGVLKISSTVPGGWRPIAG